ncbi:H-type small acid-soluble spore protein [Pullulanibacillus sp. KACC 23026]|uniref:H-type small acid-soluble spore protein n=1 Tax=Pullulanibacillus sp. KACC 23026 TaxID=3028315 RepID=UPI0023AFD916|nr:H-type small acid-soluble spore protein [Pullulanibacillus sp. KACC 23026]WEG12880.1 H-type small acid-soluble spore protein [Pullulanibacillus sp. KACC 23026]
MDAQRAKEIIDSPRTIHVLYDGMKVYIQNVNDETEIARVYPLDNPEYIQDVPVGELNEVH